MRYLIKNGRVIDPAQGLDATADLLVLDGVIAKCDARLSDKAAVVIDAGGRIVAPGFIDLHTHLREPGREDKETIRTGTRSAARGGFTSVLAMPNTEPPLDTPDRVGAVRAIAARDALVNVSVVAAITVGRAGKELTDFAALKAAGAVAFSDDGSPVEDKVLLQKALREAKKAALPIIAHCEETHLAAGGVMHKGFVSTRMGLRGIDRRAEYEAVQADLEVVRRTSGTLHVAHVSCAESVALIRQAKKEGLAVTAETAPHYFSLTDECCANYDTTTKMNPPLRTADDVAAIKAGLADGTIDAIATDHAPHTDSEKDVEFDYAPFGIIGLETALSLAVMALIDTGTMTWAGLIAALATNPGRIARLGRGTLAAGAPADIVIIDPAKEYVYERHAIESKSRNSPFIGWHLKGRPTHLLVNGRVVVEEGCIVAA